MATITLRPTADVTIGHSKYEGTETSRSNAYTLIDDTTSDQDSTTIQHRHHNTSVQQKTSTFKLGGATYNHKIFINSITIYYDYYCDNPASKGSMQSIAISTSLSINNVDSDALKNTISNVNTDSNSGWKNLNSVFNISNYDELNNCQDSISAMNLQFSITTEWKCSSSSVTTDQIIKISQVYVVVDYTDAYTFTAIGNDTTDVISPGYVRDGDTVYFDATPKLNHRFLGWYSDSGFNTQVSTSQSYSVKVNGRDVTLYANSKKIEAINVYYKKNGTWSKVKGLSIKGNGRYTTLTPKEFGDALYFSDRTYIKLKE